MPLGAPRRLWVHLLDHEVLRFHALRPDAPVVVARAADALRVSLMACRESVVLPASSFFETPALRTLVAGIPRFVDAGRVRLIGSTRSIGEFREHKQQQYESYPHRHPVYFSARPVEGEDQFAALWIVKARSTTGSIVAGLRAAIDANDERINDVIRHARSPGRLEQALHDAPDELAGQAFVGDIVLEFVGLRTGERPAALPRAALPLERMIAHGYVRSNAADANAAVLAQHRLFDDTLLPDGVTALPVVPWLKVAERLGLHDLILRAPEEILLRLRERLEWDLVADDLADRSGRRQPFGRAELRALAAAGLDGSQAVDLDDALRRINRWLELREPTEPDLVGEVLSRGLVFNDAVGARDIINVQGDLNLVVAGWQDAQRLLERVRRREIPPGGS